MKMSALTYACRSRMLTLLTNGMPGIKCELVLYGRWAWGRLVLHKADNTMSRLSDSRGYDCDILLAIQFSKNVVTPTCQYNWILSPFVRLACHQRYIILILLHFLDCKSPHVLMDIFECLVCVLVLDISCVVLSACYMPQTPNGFRLISSCVTRESRYEYSWWSFWVMTLPLICHNFHCTDVRVLGYRSVGPGSIPGTTRKKVVGLERGTPSLVSTIEKLLDRKVAATV
jgi:hypothetical protein